MEYAPLEKRPDQSETNTRTDAGRFVDGTFIPAAEPEDYRVFPYMPGMDVNPGIHQSEAVAGLWQTYFYNGPPNAAIMGHNPYYRPPASEEHVQTGSTVAPNAPSTPSTTISRAPAVQASTVVEEGFPLNKSQAEKVDTALAETGQPLPEEQKAVYEAHTGHNFSRVRIHTGAAAEEAADSIGAKAFAKGSDIVFAKDEYNPGTAEGRGLIGHELAHVAQNSAGVHRAPKKEMTQHRANFDAQGVVQKLERLFLKYHQANGRAKVLIQTEAKNEILRLLFKEPDRFRDVLLYYNARKHPYLSINLDIDLWTIADENEKKALRALFVRNGIETDEKITRYLVENPEKGEATEWQLLPEGGFRVAVPGSKIRYEFPKLSSNAPRAPRYSYQWQMIQPHSADGKQHDSAVVAGSTGKKQEFQFKNSGIHRIICRLTVYPPGGGALVSYHEFPQVVVPERQRLSEAFSKESTHGIDPALELEFLQLYYDALKKSEQQPGSHKLSEKVEEGYKKQIEKTKERLASTAHAIPVHGKIRTPIKAVYLNRESGYVMPLKLSVAKIESSPGHETWRILDTTNPAVRWMTGEYDGEGKNAKEALLNALSTMDKGGNRYPEGSIQVEIGSDLSGEKIDYRMTTTGQNALDTVIQILDTMGFWTGIGALLLTAIGAIAPIPGTRVATALLWASLLSSSAAASLSIYQRHKEGFGDGTEDAMDALTIFGNVLAGTWMAGGRVVTNKQWGIPMAKGLLIGQFSTDAVQGIILGDQYIEQYSSAMKIKDPDTRARALMEVIRSASAASAMLIISMRATKSDIELMSTSRRNLHSLGNPGEEFDLPKTEKLIKEERIRQGKEGPVKTESDQRRTEKDTNGVDKSKEREKYLSEQTTKEGVRLRNQHLAGKNHPVTGVPFDESGFPVFDDYLYKGGPNDVMIEPTGNDYFDFKAANEAAGYSRTPKGYTWHHHQNTGRMQLVDSKIHRLTGHTGGASIWYGDEKLK